MQSVKSPQRKSNEYHFCIKVTPKVLSKFIFQSKGIESLYKLQVNKGSRKQTMETMRRNLHQQALEGFYRSQNCFFTLTNYTNFRPYEMVITFSEVNSPNQEQLIFKYNFSTFGLVKNFLQNGVQRSTNVITKDFETEFYIDFYIQSNKARLQDTVKYDSNKQMFKRKKFNQMEDDDKNSDAFRKSVTSNNSPSKSSHRASSTVNYRLDKALNTRSSTPLLQTAYAWKRKKFMDQSFNDAKSEKMSNRSLRTPSQTLNFDKKDKKFLKKYPSTILNYGDNVKEQKEEIIPQKPILRKFSQNKQIISPTFSEKKAIKYEQNVKEDEKEKKINEFNLRVFLNMRDISLDEISYQIKKNILIIIFVSIIFFIVASKAIDSINFNDGRIQRRKTKIIHQLNDGEVNQVKMKNEGRKRIKRTNKQNLAEQGFLSQKKQKRRGQGKKAWQIKKI